MPQLAAPAPAEGGKTGAGEQRRGRTPRTQRRRLRRDRGRERGARVRIEDRRRADRGPRRQHHALPGDRSRVVPAVRERSHLAAGVRQGPARRAVQGTGTAGPSWRQHEPDRVAAGAYRPLAVRVLHRRRWPCRGVAAARCAGRARRLCRTGQRARFVPGGGAVTAEADRGVAAYGEEFFVALAGSGIQRLRAYDPGHDLVALRKRFQEQWLVELGSNENPHGASPAARAAMLDVMHDLHRYPDPVGGDLKRALATKHGVARGQILLGNGSHELLMQFAQVFSGPGSDVVASQFGFAVYALAAQA